MIGTIVAGLPRFIGKYGLWWLNMLECFGSGHGERREGIRGE
jgi:hypothetical protein